jgi:hypothetical protein|tara:strand:- start:963 stop:1100 length:138 start_codon:yes stop_codon:yes gene_type:complete
MQYILTLILVFFLFSCQINQNPKKIQKEKSSNLKVTIGGVKAKID